MERSQGHEMYFANTGTQCFLVFFNLKIEQTILSNWHPLGILMNPAQSRHRGRFVRLFGVMGVSELPYRLYICALFLLW